MLIIIHPYSCIGLLFPLRGYLKLSGLIGVQGEFDQPFPSEDNDSNDIDQNNYNIMIIIITITVIVIIILTNSNYNNNNDNNVFHVTYPFMHI